MTIKAIALVASLSSLLLTGTVLAEEGNKQAPAPQGTSAPDSNAKAQNPPATKPTATTEEEVKTQSPGKSEETEQSKKSKTGDGSGVSTNRAATNPEVPAPNNTSKPD